MRTIFNTWDKNKKPTQYMAIDQYGQTIHGLVNPRKDLMEKIGAYKAVKTYVDKRDGSMVHIGYALKVQGCGWLWFDLYEVTPFERKVN
jgi:hypothetical protein